MTYRDDPNELPPLDFVTPTRPRKEWPESFVVVGVPKAIRTIVLRFPRPCLWDRAPNADDWRAGESVRIDLDANDDPIPALKLSGHEHAERYVPEGDDRTSALVRLRARWFFEAYVRVESNTVARSGHHQVEQAR